MVFRTTDMGMVCVFQMVFIEMKLMYKCFYLKINNDKKSRPKGKALIEIIKLSNE